MLSLNSLKPAAPSLKAKKVPEKPMAVKALLLLAVNEKLFRMAVICEASNPAAMPLEVLLLAANCPGLSMMSKPAKSPITSKFASRESEKEVKKMCQYRYPLLPGGCPCQHCLR